MGMPRGVVVNVVYCDIAVSKFELQSRYSIYFRINTFEKGKSPLILPSFGLNNTTTIFLPMILFTNPSARAGYDTRSNFKRSLTGLNSEFSFS